MMHPTLATLEDYAQKSYAGTMNFPTLIGKLIALGVSAYFADYRRGETIYYLVDDETYAIKLNVTKLAIAEAFQSDKVIEAVRAAQNGLVHYPEFVERTMAAGCIGYIVWIAGRHVQYFGQRGDVHIEHFPPA
jgi:uncharacterized protein YbcV (DUF1398 family)